MKKFISLLTACLLGGSLVNHSFAAEMILLEGRYNCKISYVERVDISIADGADFPVGTNLETPRQRSEVLVIDFQASPEAGAIIVNPEALPNWLLINASQAQNQNSFVYIAEEERSIIYTVDWPNTWYFGSRVVVSTVSAPKNGKVKVNILFDDNDGWSQELDYVGCKKVK